MKQNLKAFYFFVFVFLSGVFSRAAFAAGAGPKTAEWKGWLWQLINFSILFIVLFVVLKKPARDYLKARTEAIKKGLDDARQARELAEAALKEVQERFSRKDAEIEAILRTAKQSGEAERETLLKEAERMNQKIAEHADTYISFELKKAKDAIRKEAVIVALELAEKKLEQKMTPEEQKKLIADAVSQLEAKS